MFDWLIETFSAYPYLGVGLVFLLCSIGLPLPEEVVLVAAGYVCFKGLANRYWMMAACGAAILAGDLIPYSLGRLFGSRIVRVRPMRFLVTPQRLARFNRWFRRWGNLVIFFARFAAGVRVVAYFTAGTLKTPLLRFVLLDSLGILIVVPPMVFLGHHFGGAIDDGVRRVQAFERGALIGLGACALVVGGWWWLRERRRQRLLVGQTVETYVEPSAPVLQEPPPDTAQQPAPEPPPALPPQPSHDAEETPAGGA
jgi:membrane protein DedA with SNARE-associated domain